MEQYSSYVFIVAIIAVFYFLIIRPQKKRQKDQADLMSNLVSGAEIMTIGGLYGTIDSIDDDRVRIVVADGTEMVFAKNAIARIVKPMSADADDAPELMADDDVADEASDKADEVAESAVGIADDSESADV